MAEQNLPRNVGPNGLRDINAGCSSTETRGMSGSPNNGTAAQPQQTAPQPSAPPAPPPKD